MLGDDHAAVPPSRSSVPTIRLVRQWIASLLIRPPASRSDTAPHPRKETGTGLMNGGNVSIAYLMPRYVEPQTCRWPRGRYHHYQCLLFLSFSIRSFPRPFLLPFPFPVSGIAHLSQRQCCRFLDRCRTTVVRVVTTLGMLLSFSRSSLARSSGSAAPNFEQVRILARDVVHLEHLGDLGQFESVPSPHSFVRTKTKAIRPKPTAFGSTDRAIAADHAAFFQLSDPFKHRRRCQTTCRHLRIRFTAVRCMMVQYVFVNFVYHSVLSANNK